MKIQDNDINRQIIKSRDDRYYIHGRKKYVRKKQETPTNHFDEKK